MFSEYASWWPQSPIRPERAALSRSFEEHPVINTSMQKQSFLWVPSRNAEDWTSISESQSTAEIIYGESAADPKRVAIHPYHLHSTEIFWFVVGKLVTLLKSMHELQIASMCLLLDYWKEMTVGKLCDSCHRLSDWVSYLCCMIADSRFQHLQATIVLNWGVEVDDVEFDQR